MAGRHGSPPAPPVLLGGGGSGGWRGKRYPTKQIEAYAVWEDDGWLVITVLVKYF